MPNNFFKNLFGAILPAKQEEIKVKSPVIRDAEDGSVIIDVSGYTRTVNLNYQFANETDLINFYREMSYFADIDLAIEDIINEAIVGNEDEPPVSIDLDSFTDKNMSVQTKEKIKDEFDTILKLLNFRNKCYEIAKRLYVDGRLYFHKIIDEDNKKQGIIETRYIDPRKIRKVRIIKSNPTYSGNSHIKLIEDYEEYFLFDPEGLNNSHNIATASIGGKIDPSAIAFVHSGLIEPQSSTIFSYLHKAIKPYNQLRLLEDSAVIYRLTRSPERRVFNIDTGNLPPDKAEEHVRKQMNLYRNKESYDPSTGSMSSQNLTMAITDDIWLPKGANGSGTTIDTLSGGETLGEIDDILFFQKKLYKALNVPISRIENEGGFSLGRVTEISRDEVKFRKFIDKFQKRLAMLFEDLLGTQLILKGICTDEEWETIKDDISYKFLSDSYFSELKEAEMTRERISLAKEAKDLPEFFSNDYIAKNILKHTEEELEEIEDDLEFTGSGDETSSPNIKSLQNLDDLDSSFDNKKSNKELKNINNKEQEE